MAAVSAWIVIGMVSVAGIETPKYDVVEKKSDYEVRMYAPRIVAEVEMEGPFQDAMNGGFRKLADYIFGNNTKSAAGGPAEKIEMTAPVLEQAATSEKIAMTAPVTEQENTDKKRVVSFVMPGKYTLQTIPQPNNPDVKLKEIPATKYAVITFSGTVSADKSKEMKQKLLDALKRDKKEATGEPLLAQYNPPWTPPPMRQNEVLVELK